MNTIDGHEYTLFRDYDKGQYQHLSYAGRIFYLRLRVDLILINPCQAAMQQALQNNMGLIVTTTICAGISAASTFWKGRTAPPGKDKEFFVGFVTEYMDQELANVAIWLYAKVRCGLAHNFTILEGGIEVGLRKYIEERNGELEIDPDRFLNDFVEGWSKYLDAVAAGGTASQLGKNFVKRFDTIFHD